MYGRYYARQRQQLTTHYPGIPQLLDALAACGMKLAIFSNKPDDATGETVRQVLGQWQFDVVRGHRPPAPLKPDPTAALAISKELDVEPEDWLYLGDSGVDMATATAAGMFAVGALWGYRDEPDLIAGGAKAVIAHPLELLKL